jgi:predicted nucleotidyltransferase
MSERFGLSEKDIAKIQAVLRRYPQVKKAILYGSRAKGTYKPGSDIDLTLVGGDDLDLSVLSHIMEEIDDLLLPYMFDLSLLSRISDPEVLGHIRRVGVVFYEKGDAIEDG